jgi:hypothetical protein
MPSTIDDFDFESPKTVKSGRSIKLNVTVTVVQGPKTLTISGSNGYTCEPPSKSYPTGTHVEVVRVLIKGPPGTCLVRGRLALSKRNDAVEVT